MAPRPRPPQPIMPTLISSLPPAWALMAHAGGQNGAGRGGGFQKPAAGRRQVGVHEK